MYSVGSDVQLITGTELALSMEILYCLKELPIMFLNRHCITVMELNKSPVEISRHDVTAHKPIIDFK